jgi:hypothetical protein
MTLQVHCGTAFQVAHKKAKLFDQTLQANMEILHIKETVFGVPSPVWSATYGQHSPLSRCTGSSIALAATYALAIGYRMQQHLLAV